MKEGCVCVVREMRMGESVIAIQRITYQYNHTQLGQSVHFYVCVHVHIHVHVYQRRGREREREESVCIKYTCIRVLLNQTSKQGIERFYKCYECPTHTCTSTCVTNRYYYSTKLMYVYQTKLPGVSPECSTDPVARSNSHSLSTRQSQRSYSY